ncbi:MAG TPA: hypothetical protein VFV05_03405 [Methylomirabilota bacterium]|nr:hypothetical protein [Methylomirabilota bacterium]
METLAGILILSAPVVGVAALTALVDRRRTRRRAEIARQIALTDALHARLGAAVAPFVRWRRHRWEVAVAVPFERPAVVAVVLATVDETFRAVTYELVLSRQAAPAPAPRTRRPAPVGAESLSWT